jgi:hypothetical protein
MIDLRARRFFRLVLVSAAALSIAGRASAQAAPNETPDADPDVTVYRGAPQRLVVDRFEGPGSEVARAAVIEALEAEPSIEVVSVRFYKQAAGALDGSPASYAAVAKRLTLSAILRGKTSQRGDGYTVTLSVVSGDSGEIVSRLRFAGRHLPTVRTKIKSQLWPFLSPILRPSSARGSPDAATPPLPGTTPAPPEATPRETPASSPPPESAKPPGAEDVPMFPRPFTAQARPIVPRAPASTRCPWLGIGATGGVLRRLFGYHEEQRGPLRAYVLDKSPVLGVETSLFPFVAPPCHGTRGLGFAGAYELMLGAHSQVGGRTLTTTGSALSLEALYRFRVANVSITPRLGYRGRFFNVEGDVVPDVAYSAPRLALELGIRLGPVFGEVTGAGSVVLAAGELDSTHWFPNASGLSYAFDAKIGVEVTDSASVVLGGQVEMYRFRLNVPKDSAAPNGVAGSTTDRFLSASLAVRFQLSREASR